MTLTQLEYVLAVDEYRHFNKAAKACHVTQPTLSVQLQKLEEELQVMIFDRSKSPIIPTTEGERIVRQVRKVLAEARGVWSVVEDSRKELRGSFKIGVIPTLSPYLIPLFLPYFQKMHPKVDLQIEEVQTDVMVKQLDEDRLDAGLLVTPLGHEFIIEKPLYYEKFFIFASAEHKLLRKKRVSEKDLDYRDVWLLNEGHCFRDQVLRICSLPKGEGRANLSFESGSLETLKNLVLRMGGYTFLPEMAVESLTSSLKKQTRELTRPTPSREVSLVYGRAFYKGRLIKALEEAILSSLPQHFLSVKKESREVIPVFGQKV